MNKYNLVLFAGGKGTRMGSISSSIPKPMVLINGKPLIERVIDLYSNLINKVIICAGYKYKIIKDYFQNRDNIVVINTGLETGTAKRLEIVKDMIEGDTFLLNYSDALSDISIDKVIQFHHEKNSDFTIVSVNPPTTFGIITCDEAGKLCNFLEKQKIKNVFINGGFFVCSKSFLSFFENLEESIMFEDKHMTDKYIYINTYTYRHRSFWQCVDTVKDVVILEKYIRENNL